MSEWRCNVLIRDVHSYHPDTLDLNSDTDAASYWFPCFQQMIEKFARQAALSQQDTDPTAEQRAQQFQQAYLGKLKEYEKQRQYNATHNKILGTRELLELNEKQLRIHGFEDPWRQQKQSENKLAVRLFIHRIHELDSYVCPRQRWTELIRGVLAGNMFDSGAQAVTNIIKEDANFGLKSALERIQKRPWLMDDLDAWLQRIHDHIYKCAVIFVDNSGVDVVLGILPFARELLKRGTKILLCGNTEPALNDVTSRELVEILDECNYYCPIIRQARLDKHLLVYGNGQRGPCLDMRTLPKDLCQALQTHQTDLLVIEGMGRTLHTNLYARFHCDTLKLAVVKNKWLAERLGGQIFAVICKYEPLIR